MSPNVFARYTDDYREIEPTNSDFNNAPTYSSVMNVKQTISTAGDFNLIHYSPNSSGAYNYFSIGSEDTVGMLFQRKNFIFNYYVWLDDDDDSGDELNFRIEIDLESGKDYYLASRLFGNNTGYYYLNLRPNIDTASAINGGKWEQDPDYYDVDNQITSKIRTYYTSNQTAVLYLMLEEEIYSELEEYRYFSNSMNLISNYIRNTMDIGLNILNDSSLIGLVISFIESAIFSTIDTSNTSQIIELINKRLALKNAADITTIVDGDDIISTVNYGVTETAYQYKEVSAILNLILGIIGGGSWYEIGEVHNVINYSRTYTNTIKGITRQRGEIEVY